MIAVKISNYVSVKKTPHQLTTLQNYKVTESGPPSLFKQGHPRACRQFLNILSEKAFPIFLSHLLQHLSTHKVKKKRFCYVQISSAHCLLTCHCTPSRRVQSHFFIPSWTIFFHIAKISTCWCRIRYSNLALGWNKDVFIDIARAVCVT